MIDFKIDGEEEHEKEYVPESTGKRYLISVLK